MKIVHESESRTIRNILIGEVWQASGQSNMQWTVMGETHKDEALRLPPNDKIRLFKQQRRVAAEPVFDTLPTGWLPPTASASRRHFSAVAYYFARESAGSVGSTGRDLRWPVMAARRRSTGRRCTAFERKAGFQGHIWTRRLQQETASLGRGAQSSRQTKLGVFKEAGSRRKKRAAPDVLRPSSLVRTTTG
jgi:hypothetical protein